MSSSISSLGSRVKRDRMIYLMITPGILFILIFCYVPLFGIIIAFKDYSPFTGVAGIFSSKWVGFDHFIRFFHSPSFGSILTNTLLMSLYKLIFAFPAPIILAILLNEVRHMKYKRIVQSISYLPYFLSIVIVVGVLNSIVANDGGLINQFRQMFGQEPILFLGEENYYRSILTITYIWQHIGYGSIIYIAAISGIDPELYEAAEMDGAGALRKIWSITLPSISYVISIMFILFMGSILASEYQFILLTYSPATYAVADTIDTFVYREGLVNASYSFSTAVGLFKSFFAAALLLLANFLSKKLGQSGIW